MKIGCKANIGATTLVPTKRKWTKKLKKKRKKIEKKNKKRGRIEVFFFSHIFVLLDDDWVYL